MIGEKTHLLCYKCRQRLVHASRDFLTCLTRDRDGNLCRGLIGQEQANAEQRGLRPIPKESPVAK